MTPDPIADMLTQIRNALMSRRHSVEMEHSKLKHAIASVLHAEGYIAGYEKIGLDPKWRLRIDLAYRAGQPAIREIRTVSRPGCRVYHGSARVPRYRSGLGHYIYTTSRGVMTDRDVRRLGIGGECLASVW